MDNWKKLKRLYVDDHNSKKDLAAPQIRLNALESIDKLMMANFKDLVDHPKILKQIDKEDLKGMLSIKKGSKLNSAEESVINGLYTLLEEL